MGLELKEQFAAQLRRDGGRIAPMPDGPLLPRFDALELAQAIEHTVNQSAGLGHTKVKLDLSFDDAMLLARHLRRGVLLGA